MGKNSDTRMEGSIVLDPKLLIMDPNPYFENQVFG